MRSLSHHEVEQALPIEGVFLPRDAVEEHSWITSGCEDPHKSIIHSSEPFHAVRGAAIKIDGTRRWVYCSDGPMGTMVCKDDPVTGYGGGLFYDNRDGTAAARKLEPFEIWSASGFVAKLWRQSLQAGCLVPQLMRGVAHSLPMSTAQALVEAAIDATIPETTSRGGVAFDKDEEEARLHMRMWLLA